MLANGESEWNFFTRPTRLIADGLFYCPHLGCSHQIFLALRALLFSNDRVLSNA
jgi:hypothetical protein